MKRVILTGNIGGTPTWFVMESPTATEPVGIFFTAADALAFSHIEQKDTAIALLGKMDKLCLEKVYEYEFSDERAELTVFLEEVKYGQEQRKPY